MAAQTLERYAREFKNHHDLEEHYEYALAKSDALKNLLVDEKINEIRANLAKSKSLPLHYVRCVVTREQQQRLQADFGQYYYLDFSRSVDREAHAYSREHRRLSEKYIYDYLFKYRDNKRVPTGFDCLVKDVGGNPWKHVVNNRRLVHSCCPICDANDSLRNATYHRLLADNDLTDERLIPCLNDHLNRDPRVICETKSQYCDIKSKFVIFLHSAYNIQINDMATIMARANAEYAVAVVIFHEKILLEQSGYIDEQEVYFRKYVKKKILYIDFFFKGDHQNGYTHRFDTYIALIKCFRLQLQWEDGNRYYDVTCIGDRSCVRFYQIQQVTARVVPAARVFRSITSKSYEGKLAIYTWDYLTLLGRNIISKDHMVPVRIVVPTRLFEDIYSYGLTLTDTRFLPKNLMNAGVSFNSKEIIDGQTIGVRERISPVVLSLLVYTIYHLLYINNYEKTQLLVRLQRDETRVRSNRTWLSRFFSRVSPMQVEKFNDILSSDTSGHLLSNTRDQHENTFCDFIMSKEEREFDITSCTVELLDCMTVDEELDMITTVTNPRSFTSMSNIKSMNEALFPTEKLRAFLTDQFGKGNDIDEAVEVENQDVIDSNIEQIESVHVCDRDVVAVDTIGDGNCGFHAVRINGATTDDPTTIRKRLSTSKYLPKFVQREQVMDSLTDGVAPVNWATLDTLCLFAHEYGVQLCVHNVDDFIVRFGDTSDKLYCVRHNGGNHWEAMIERSELDPILTFTHDCSSERGGMIVEPLLNMPIDNNLEDIENRCFGNDISRTKWRTARSAIYDLESLGSCGYVCRSALKLKEIFLRYPEFQPSTGGNVLDICAGPGSWTQVLLEYSIRTCFGVTHTKLIDYNHAIRDPRLNIVRAIMDEDGTDSGDILDHNILNGIITIINENSDAGISLAVADGMNCGEEGPFDAAAMFQLTCHEIMLAFFTMRPGANFILKGIRPTSRYSTAVFNRLVNSFHTVRCVRLDTSRPTSGEFYFLCEGFTGEWTDTGIYDVEADESILTGWTAFAVDMTKKQIDNMYRVRALALSGKRETDYDYGENRAARYRKLLSRTLRGGYIGKNIACFFHRKDDTLREYFTILEQMQTAKAADLCVLRSRLEECFKSIPRKTTARNTTSPCGDNCSHVRRAFTNMKKVYYATENAIINSVDETIVRVSDEAREVVTPYRNDLHVSFTRRIMGKLLMNGIQDGVPILHTIDTKLTKRVLPFAPSETALPPVESALIADDVIEAIETKSSEIIKKDDIEEKVLVETLARDEKDIEAIIMNISFSSLDKKQEEFISTHNIDIDGIDVHMGENHVVERERFHVALVCQDSDGVIDEKAFERCMLNLRSLMEFNHISIVTLAQNEIITDNLKKILKSFDDIKIRIVNSDDNTVMTKDAVREYRDYLISVHECEMSNHVRLYGKVCSMLRVTEIVQGEYGNYGILRYGNFVVKPRIAVEKYRVCFVKNASGYAFVPYEAIHGYELAIVSDYCKHMLEPMFVDAINSIDTDKQLPPVGFIQAAPGSGKTTLILREHSPANTDNPSLVILSTVEGKDDFRRRSEKMHGFTLDGSTRRFYRTAASYLLRPDVTSDTLYIDESLMHHPGLIIAIIILSKAKIVNLLGDRHQIPFVNRNKTFICKYTDLMRFFKVTRTLNTTFRCPQDVTFLLRKDYKDLITARPVLRSLEIRSITTVKEVPIVEKAVYLTFTQSEKEELSRHINAHVSTVHEYQGKENPHIIIVRTSPREQDAIYNKPEYPRVAISRANTKTTYYTACSSDTLSRWINEALAVDDNQISQVFMKGGIMDEHVILNRCNKAIATLDISNVRLFSSPRNIIIFVPRRGYYSKDYGYGSYRKDRITERHVGGRKVFEVFSGDKPSLIDIRESLKELRCHTFGDLSANGDILMFLDEQLLSNVFRKHYHGYSIRLHTGCSINQIHPNVFHLMNKNGICGIPNAAIEHTINQEVNTKVRYTPDVKYNIIISYDSSGVPSEIDNVYHNGKALILHHVPVKDRILTQKQMRNLEKAVCLLPGNIRIGFLVDERLKSAYINFITSSKIGRRFIIEGKREDTPQCDHGLIQEIVRRCMPGTYMSDSELDAWMVHNYDFKLAPGECVYRKYPIYTQSMYDTLRPILNTPVPRLREYTSRETLLAYYKRNACVPQLTGIVSYTEQAAGMARNFVRELLDEKLFKKYTAQKIRVSEVEIDEWLSKQDTCVVEQINPESALHDTGLDTYEFSIKRQPKPNLTIHADKTYTALQTIVYHPKTVNAIFCIIFKQMKLRLLACLRRHVKLFCDVSPDDFAEMLNRDIPYSTAMRFLEKLEIDISKYDKSQREISLELEILLMRAFGVSEYHIRLWLKAHIVSTVKCRGTGFKAVINYQRKSGDASTFLGNTMFLMAVLATELPISKCALALFSGDDSLIYGNNLIQKLDTQRLALIYNLECKVFRFEMSYFCSKFLVIVNDRWVFVPDPVKVAVKLGRHDLKNTMHLEEYRVSLHDNNRQFKDPDVCRVVAKALKERYHIPFDLSLHLQELYNVTFSDNINRIYYIPEGAVLDQSASFSHF